MTVGSAGMKQRIPAHLKAAPAGRDGALWHGVSSPRRLNLVPRACWNQDPKSPADFTFSRRRGRRLLPKRSRGCLAGCNSSSSSSSSRYGRILDRSVSFAMVEAVTSQSLAARSRPTTPERFECSKPSTCWRWLRGGAAAGSWVAATPGTTPVTSTAASSGLEGATDGGSSSLRSTSSSVGWGCTGSAAELLGEAVKRVMAV